MVLKVVYCGLIKMQHLIEPNGSCRSRWWERNDNHAVVALSAARCQCQMALWGQVEFGNNVIIDSWEFLLAISFLLINHNASYIY